MTEATNLLHVELREREAFLVTPGLRHTEVVVETPARVHLGSLDMNGSLGRFGIGFGFAVKRPRVVVKCARAATLTVEGPARSLVERHIEVLCRDFGLERNVAVTVEETIPLHQGLGAGTQLALACGEALCVLNGVKIPIRRIAQHLHRSHFSGVGLAIYERGGFVLDSGYTPSSFRRRLPVPVQFTHHLPAKWEVLIVIPRVRPHVPSIHVGQFSDPLVPLPETRKMVHLAMSRLVPALVERDFPSFCLALKELGSLGFKRLELQRNPPMVHTLIRHALTAGAGCAGLSSGGPSVYALVDSPAVRGDVLKAWSLLAGGTATIYVGQAANGGRKLLVL